MKNILKYILLSIVPLLFLGCEKDDICADIDPKTQSVLIEFYDKNNPKTTKTPNGLVAYVTGYDIAIAAVGSTLNLPLMIDANTTTWNLVLNGADDDTDNDITDQITFNYEVQQEYISSSCGYKANFILDNSQGVTVTNNWIDSVQIVKPNIVNPDEVHIKIYF